MMFSRKKIMFLLLLLIPISHATALKLTTDHAEYEPSSSVLISGVVIGDNAADYGGATATIDLSNSTTTAPVSGDNVSFSASVTAPPNEGNHRYTVSVTPSGGAQHERTLVGHGVLKVRNAVTLTLSKDKSEYFVGDSVVITVTARNSSGDPYYNLSLDLRLLNSTGDAIYSESASTNANGTKQFTLTSLPASDFPYTVVVNEVYSLKFSVSTFTASLIVTDSFGNPSSFFRSGDSASFQIKVLKNGRPLTSSEAAGNPVTGSVTTTTVTSPKFSFSFRNDTFAYDYNITSGAGRYRVDATVALNATRTLSSEFWVNDYKVEVFPVYASEYYSGKFTSGENVTLAARILNMSSGGYVDNASLVLSIYDSRGRLLSLNYSVSLPADAGDRYFLLNHYFRISIANTSEGRYSVVVNATIGDFTAQGFGEFTISSGVVDAYAVSADGSTRKTIFSLDDTVRIKVNLYGTAGGPAAITSLKFVSLKDNDLHEVAASGLQYNLSSGIISFSVPKTGGWYTAEVMANGNSVGYASFLAHLYQIVGRPYKNASISGYSGWNYFGTQDDVLLDVYVYSTSSRESADTTVTISSASTAGVSSLGFTDTQQVLRPRIKTVGTVGIDSAAVQEDVQNVQTETQAYMESVAALGNESNSSSGGGGGAISRTSTLASRATPVGYYGETLNEVQGVKVSVVGIANGRTWEEVDVSRIANGTTDSSGHTTISIPKPQGGWQSGWYTIVLKGQKIVDNETVLDYGSAWFEVKSFWVWAYPTGGKWYFSSGEVVNITVEVRDVSSYAGIANVSVNITDVYQYSSEDGYSFSARRANYTTAANVTNENGTAILYLTPSTSWRNGWYNVQVRAGNGTDYGWTGFSVKTFDVWGHGVDSNNNYKWAFGLDDNISINVFVREPGKYNCWYGGCNVPGINVSVLKVYDTTTWPAKDVTSRLNLTTVRALTTADGAVLNMSAPAGGWGVGNYYAVIEAVNSTDAVMRDTGNAWFSIRAFDVVAVPLKNGAYSYVFGTNDTITYNISVCKAGTVRTEYSYSSNAWVVSSCTPANASINDVRISTWSYPVGYQEIPINVTGNGTYSDNTRIMTLRRPNTTWAVGWYSINFKVYAPNQNISQSEYAGFSVRSFDVFVDQPTSYFSRSNTVNFSVLICEPGGCDYYYNSSYSNPWVRKTAYYTSSVQFKADTVYGPSGYVVVNKPQVDITGTGTYNLSPPSTNWTDGWYSVSFSAGPSGNSQSGWSWFNVKSFTASGYPTKWQYSATELINITITTKSPSGNPILIDSVGSITLMRQPEGSYYGYSQVSGFNVSSSIGSGTTSVVLSSSGWEPGYYYATIPVSYGGAIQTVWVSFYVSLFEVQVRTDYPSGQWYFTPSNEMALNVSVCNIGSYNYYSGSCDYYTGNVTLRIEDVYTYDSSWRQVRVPTTATTYSFNGTSRIVLNLSSLSSGSYNVQMLVSDSGSRSKRAYGWFEVKTFELFVYAMSPQRGYFTPTDNLTFNITACLPGASRNWYYDSGSSQWLVNCSTYGSPVNATLTSLQRYDRNTWNYVNVAVRNVSVQFTGVGALSINRTALYDAPLAVGEYYANVRVSDSSNAGVYGTASSWFNVKIFEIVSQPNTPEGYYLLPNENFSFGVKVCSPGTRNETWNYTAHRYDYACVPYPRNVTAELSVSSMYAPVTWAYAPVDVAVNYSVFSGSAILNLSNSLLPNDGASLKRGYYNYRVKISDASDSSVYDYIYSSVYVKHFDANAYVPYAPAVSTTAPLNVTVYGYARNGTYLALNVTSVSLLKYDYSTGAYTQVLTTGFLYNDSQWKLTLSPADAWASASYNVRVNMTSLGTPSKVEEAYGSFWVS